MEALVSFRNTEPHLSEKIKLNDPQFMPRGSVLLLANYFHLRVHGKQASLTHELSVTMVVL